MITPQEYLETLRALVLPKFQDQAAERLLCTTLHWKNQNPRDERMQGLNCGRSPLDQNIYVYANATHKLKQVAAYILFHELAHAANPCVDPIAALFGIDASHSLEWRQNMGRIGVASIASGPACEIAMNPNNWDPSLLCTVNSIEVEGLK